MKVKAYKSLSGNYRISEFYGMSESAYKQLKKVGLPVYESMSGSLNLRDSRSYTKEQVIKIKKIIEGE